MKMQHAIEVLHDWDKRGKYVFTKRELQKLFPDDKPKTLSEGLNRLVKANILKRVCRGIYVNENANSFDSDVIERIAIALRKGEYTYVSLESMLSEYGLISQVPIDRLTLMTTGREGTYKTPYGTIEFTHTQRSRKKILAGSHRVSRPSTQKTITTQFHPLRIANKQTALRDLKRVGRNINLVKMENDNE